MAVNFTAKISGVKETTDRFGSLSKQEAAKLEQVLGKWGREVLKRAQGYVPVEYGILRASGYVQTHKGEVLSGMSGQAVKSKDLKRGRVYSVSQEVGISIGFSAEYAIFVHENMQQKLKGKPRPSGKGVYWGPRGRPKFLQIAVREMQSQIIPMYRAEHNRSSGAVNQAVSKLFK